jgi:hypothetical protein
MTHSPLPQNNTNRALRRTDAALIDPGSSIFAVDPNKAQSEPSDEELEGVAGGLSAGVDGTICCEE